MGHFENGVVDARQLGGPVHLLGRSLDVPVLQVVEDGVVEQHRVLRGTQRFGKAQPLVSELHARPNIADITHTPRKLLQFGARNSFVFYTM